MLEPWIIETFTKVINTAETMVILQAGFMFATFIFALVAYSMCILINLIATPFIRKKTIGEPVARSLGKALGGIVGAWREGWALGIVKGDGDGRGSQHDGEIQGKKTGEVCERDGLRLVADRSIPSEQGEFELAMDVEQERKVALGKHDEGLEFVGDGELVENKWRTKEL